MRTLLGLTSYALWLLALLIRTPGSLNSLGVGGLGYHHPAGLTVLGGETAPARLPAPCLLPPSSAPAFSKLPNSVGGAGLQALTCCTPVSSPTRMKTALPQPKAWPPGALGEQTSSRIRKALPLTFTFFWICVSIPAALGEGQRSSLPSHIPRKQLQRQGRRGHSSRGRLWAWNPGDACSDLGQSLLPLSLSSWTHLDPACFSSGPTELPTIPRNTHHLLTTSKYPSPPSCC